MITKNKSGFSLVELATSLVIIGFIVSAVLYGKALSKKAEGRAILSEMTIYLSAVEKFRNKYHGRPGDIANSSRYFTGAAINDGVANANNTWDTGEERDVLWIQLYQAEMITQNMSVVADSTDPGAIDRVIGVNRPSSKINGVGWTFIHELDIDPPGTVSSIKYYSVLRFGGFNSAEANGGEYLTAPMMPISLHSYIDSKIDTPNTPLSGFYIVDAACADEASAGVYIYKPDTTILCTGNRLEFNTLVTGTYTP